MNPPLTHVEVRILGALAEKSVTTPDNYPLSLSALTAACNQTTNRDPVMQLDDDTVTEAIVTLRRRSFLRAIQPAGSRVTKYQHLLGDALDVDAREIALLGVLMLRGPQTPGELHARTARLAEFTDIADMESVLDSLIARDPLPLVTRLPKRAGQKEVRFAHLLSGPVTAADDVAAAEPDGSMRTPLASAGDRVEVLQRSVDELRAELAELRAQFVGVSRGVSIEAGGRSPGGTLVARGPLRHARRGAGRARFVPQALRAARPAATLQLPHSMTMPRFRTPSATRPARFALLSTALVASGLRAPLSAQGTVPAISAADLRTRLFLIADDSMGGRATGSRGNYLAAEYIAAEFKRAGLQPAGENGSWFQEIPFFRMQGKPGDKLMAGSTTLTLGKDYIPGAAAHRCRARSTASAPSTAARWSTRPRGSPPSRRATAWSSSRRRAPSDGRRCRWCCSRGALRRPPRSRFPCWRSSPPNSPPRRPPVA